MWLRCLLSKIVWWFLRFFSFFFFFFYFFIFLFLFHRFRCYCRPWRAEYFRWFLFERMYFHQVGQSTHDLPLDQTFNLSRKAIRIVFVLCIARSKFELPSRIWFSYGMWCRRAHPSQLFMDHLIHWSLSLNGMYWAFAAWKNRYLARITRHENCLQTIIHERQKMEII